MNAQTCGFNIFNLLNQINMTNTFTFKSIGYSQYSSFPIYLLKPFILLLIFMMPVFSIAQTVEEFGYSCVPGHPGKIIKWRNAYAKSPGPATNSIHYWFNIELHNPQPGDDVTFVICAMLNIDKPAVSNPAYSANIVGGEWVCSTNGGTQSWFPNYHFGCKRIHLTAANPKDNTSFDQTVMMNQPFTNQEIASSYIDIAVDCPQGFSASCNNIFNMADQWLVPGDGAFPSHSGSNVPSSCPGNSGTSSFWIANGGNWVTPPLNDFYTVEERFLMGNWYTMANLGNNFETVLTGEVTNLPGGATVQFTYPTAQGMESIEYLVPGEECTGNEISIEIPIQINEEVIAVQEHIYMKISGETSPCQQYPSGEIIQFRATSIALNETFFPNGDILFSPGDAMHGVFLQFIGDYEPPEVGSTEVIRNSDGEVSIRIKGVDETTMALAATLEYSIDGELQPILPIPYDSIPEIGDSIVYRADLGSIPNGAILEYKVYLADEVGNESESETFVEVLNAVVENGIIDLIQVSIYPTIIDDRINIKIKSPTYDGIDISIFNTNGQKVTSKNIAKFSGEKLVDMNLSKLTTGIYFINIRSSNSGGSISKKFIKK